MPESFLVIVKCMTFNHHAYIEDAMNGFCMQKTDFPYLCIVMDDCSADGEQEVIKNYVAEHFNSITNEETDDYVLNLCQHKTNENCYFAVFYLKYNHYSIKKEKGLYYSKWLNNSKYVALCEGDDYWIDESKLQKQVVFLEENVDYGMCFTSFNILYQSKNRIEYDLFNTKPCKYKTKYNLQDWIISRDYLAPMSWLVKKDLWNNIPNIQSCDGTFVYVATFLAKSKIKYIDKITCVYRVLESSASHSNDLKTVYLRNSNLIQTTLELIKCFRLPEEFKQKCLQKYYHVSFKLFIIFDTFQVLRHKYNSMEKKSFIEKVEFFLGMSNFGRLLFRLLYSFHWKYLRHLI